jgi:hypothetical protein
VEILTMSQQTSSPWTFQASRCWPLRRCRAVLLVLPLLLAACDGRAAGEKPPERTEGAIRAARKRIARDPRAARAHLALGTALHARGMLDAVGAVRAARHRRGPHSLAR